MGSQPPPELSEKDFIQEGYTKNPFQLWVWLFLSLAVLLTFWIGTSWYQSKMEPIFNDSPFLQVTNRQLSLFLWQNPEFMRINAKEKSYYLPGFLYIDKVTAEVSSADEYAIAPPEVLFRYHTWDRLIKDEFIPTPIPSKEFLEFLSYDEQWLPIYWSEAPTDYIALLNALENQDFGNLEQQPFSALPQDVRIAFQGWKNYFIDKEVLNQAEYTYSQVAQFLKNHPHYARNYWRNILSAHIPNYLISVKQKSNDPVGIIPSKELSGFLRAALFNYSTMQKPSG